MANTRSDYDLLYVLSEAKDNGLNVVITLASGEQESGKIAKADLNTVRLRGSDYCVTTIRMAAVAAVKVNEDY